MSGVTSNERLQIQNGGMNGLPESERIARADPFFATLNIPIVDGGNEACSAARLSPSTDVSNVRHDWISTATVRLSRRADLGVHHGRSRPLGAAARPRPLHRELAEVMRSSP